MASRYIARRYGEQAGSRSRASSVVSESTSRASSQIRETSSFFPRAASLAPPSRGSSPVDDPYERPWSSASHYTSSHDSHHTRDHLFTDFVTSLPLSSSSPTTLRTRYRELGQGVAQGDNNWRYRPGKSVHLPTWTSSWKNYRGRGAQFTSQFLGKERSESLTTPTYNPPRVFIFHKSTVN